MPRVPVGDLQLYMPEADPMGPLAAHVLGVVAKAPRLLRCRLHPSSCHIDFLEIHIRALSTHHFRVGLHAKKCFVSTLSTRDVYQNMLAWLHQIETLAMNVLQVGVASGSHSSGASDHGRPRRKRRICLAGCRAG